ncbi:MAG: hypothetical protein SWK76_01260 [Actinomycetota bacterium]|nr:hypothetical protein [Actinomycetota bacterium]
MSGEQRALWSAVPGIVTVLVMVVMLLGCQGSPAKDPDSPEALKKATQLQEKLEEAGLPVPDTDTIVKLYGTNGGVACMYSDSDFQIYYNLSHFGNTGRRPTYIDPDVIAYDRAVIEVYCPENLDAFLEAVEEWDTEEILPNR